MTRGEPLLKTGPRVSAVVSELLHTLTEYFDSIAVMRRISSENAYPQRQRSILRLRSAWHGKHRYRDSREQRAPLHHAITSQRDGQDGAARMRLPAAGVKGSAGRF